LQRALESFWSDWRIGLATAAGLAAGFGVASAWLTPRGPATTSEALVSMAAALVTGMAAGLVTRTRWSMLTTPVVSIAVFELARIGGDGPTVDGIHLGTVTASS
jgi:hypothetical protein